MIIMKKLKLKILEQIIKPATKQYNEAGIKSLKKKNFKIKSNLNSIEIKDEIDETQMKLKKNKNKNRENKK